MENELILLDTSVLIDYYRKTDKSNSYWVSLIRKKFTFAISAISQYEIYAGATKNQLQFWDDVFKKVAVIPFDKSTVISAVKINSSLKKKRKQINIPDLFIAATAVSQNIRIATLNKKHFVRIDELTVIE